MLVNQIWMRYVVEKDFGDENVGQINVDIGKC